MFRTVRNVTIIGGLGYAITSGDQDAIINTIHSISTGCIKFINDMASGVYNSFILKIQNEIIYFLANTHILDAIKHMFYLTR